MKPDSPPTCKVKVTYPGYWADGKTFPARKATLQIRSGAKWAGTNQRWGAGPSDEEGVSNMDCYIIHTPLYGNFGIPASMCLELTP